MALQPLKPIDVEGIQFKLYNKHIIFEEGQLHNNVSLLSAASNAGLLFAGNPNAPEIKVFLLTDLVESHVEQKKPLVRIVQIAGVPSSIACSADGTQLAIACNMNGTNILQIYQVASFLKSSCNSLYTVRLSPENTVNALQLLWNPVLTNMLAVVLTNGALVLYTFKDDGKYELHSIDKSQNVQCGCWSPKGKQIVLGFENGKLQQFKPDLTPAKTILCPPNIHASPFNTIAVHWLSTFQFAVVFLHEQNPCIYIVDAPKGSTPNYTIYYDICYSDQGPRAHQYTFTHIAQWNLLLVCSANGVEIGVLATKDVGDAPKWQQYSLMGEARIELPLAKSKDETYPIGFTLDTSVTHQLVTDEKALPFMPMVHVLSTHGHLVSYDFLNLMENTVDICSPSQPINDESGEFCALNVAEVAQTNDETQQQQQKQETQQQQPQQQFFNYNSGAYMPQMVGAQPNFLCPGTDPFSVSQLMARHQTAMQQWMQQVFSQYMDQFARFANGQPYVNGNNLSSANANFSPLWPTYPFMSSSLPYPVIPPAEFSTTNSNGVPTQADEQVAATAVPAIAVVDEPGQEAEAAAAEPRFPLIAQEDMDNRDWLDSFFSITRLAVFLTILYFNSSPIRCLVVFVIATFIYLYHIGVLRFHRERNNNNINRNNNENGQVREGVQQVQRQQQQTEDDASTDGEQDDSESSEGHEQSANETVAINNETNNNNENKL